MRGCYPPKGGMICVLNQSTTKERKTAMSKCITIGMDLGNEKHAVCALDESGQILFRKDIDNKPEVLEPFFREHAGATVAMETGLCCRWISALAKSCGCNVIVCNARKLAAIWQNQHKNDENDALLLAQLTRADLGLVRPVALRDDEHHEIVQIIELRAVAVSQRTQAVNAVRGLCKACGVFIPKCDASCFHKVAAEAIPQGVAWKFGPMLRHLRETEALIGKYDKMLARYADAHFGEEVGLLQTIPGVGMLTACAFVAFVDDVRRFGKARDVGVYFGLTPAQDKSGSQDVPRRITKAGNGLMRSLLVNAANYILRKSSPDTALKRHGMAICARGGKVAKRKAKVAVARKLAVVMFAMLRSGRPYEDAALSSSNGLVA